MSTHPRAATLPVQGDVDGWMRVGRRMTVTEGVHAPSWFSAVLSACLPEVHGRVVLDVGSGAGMVSIASLHAGATRVVALDLDARALDDTRRNVRALLGENAGRRLTTVEADWSELTTLVADIALVNPPQRPSALLADTPLSEGFHIGGGVDGLDGLRRVLSMARTPEVYSTASSLLRPASSVLHSGAYGPPSLHASCPVVHDPVWAPLTATLTTDVDLWRFTRTVDVPPLVDTAAVPMPTALDRHPQRSS